VASAAVSGAFLLLLASPFLRLQVGTSDLSAYPSALESVRAVELLNRRWPGGSTVNLQVVVTKGDDPAVQRAIADFSQRVLAIPGVSGPPETKQSPTTHAALLTYLLPGTPNDESNRDIVRRVRSEVVPAVFGPLAGVQALVTGDVAATLDEVNHFRDALPRVFTFVLGLSFLLLLIAFRSLVIPVKAIVLNLLSTAAAYGALVLVFQEGWFANVLDVKPGVVEDFVPLFVFTILFGLSMDYHVFILMRIKEAHDRGVGSNEAVVRGISITSGTVTSAAAIMVCVFAVFVTLRLAVVKEIGLGLAVAVLLDATVVRSVLLPASMRLLGEWNWWLPRWLSWIPRVTLETDSLEPGTLRPAVAASSVSVGSLRPMLTARTPASPPHPRPPALAGPLPRSPAPVSLAAPQPPPTPRSATGLSKRGRALLALGVVGVGFGAVIGGLLRGLRRR